MGKNPIDEELRGSIANINDSPDFSNVDESPSS